jgi:hypothetical protein
MATEPEVQAAVQAMVDAVSATTEYFLGAGSERIQYKVHTLQPHQHSRNSTAQLQYISFFGRCYHCKYLGHSQKYCPLRLCKQCQRHGHSEYVCWKSLPPPRT